MLLLEYYGYAGVQEDKDKRKDRKMERCCVSDQYCKTPANLEQPPKNEGEQITVRTKCFACDEPVCAACSLFRAWYGHRRKRICFTCDNNERDS